MSRHHRRVRVVSALITTAIAAVTLLLLGLLWPYSAVSYPDGNIGTVEPPTVGQGGSITVTYPRFCNSGQDILIDRWADVLVDGQMVAAFALPAVEFFPTKPLGCVGPIEQTVSLPNYVVGAQNQDATFRLRFVTTYKPNPIRTVRVESFTEPFVIRAN